jgi:hypothetical protein
VVWAGELRWSGAGSNRRPSAFQVNRAERRAGLRKRTSLTSGIALGGKCDVHASRGRYARSTTQYSSHPSHAQRVGTRGPRHTNCACCNITLTAGLAIEGPRERATSRPFGPATDGAARSASVPRAACSCTPTATACQRSSHGPSENTPTKCPASRPGPSLTATPDYLAWIMQETPPNNRGQRSDTP